MSGGFLGRITRRIGRALVSAGLGAPSGGAPPPTIITGPCTTQLFGDPLASSLLASTSADGALLTTPETAGAFGDIMISGFLADPQIEGTEINVC